MPDETATVDVAAQDEPKVSLVEFCSRVSETLTRPELINGFHHKERAAGRLKDTTTAYRARFDAFVNAPV